MYVYEVQFVMVGGYIDGVVFVDNFYFYEVDNVVIFKNIFLIQMRGYFCY